jgi:transposase InsO family protein
MGIRVVQTPYRAPNANAHAERFVRSIKEECLNRLVPLAERHHRRAVAEFVTQYHRERNHQGLDNELIDASGSLERISLRVVIRSLLPRDANRADAHIQVPYSQSLPTMD